MIGRDPKICRNGHRYDGGCVREMRCSRCCLVYGCSNVAVRAHGKCVEHDPANQLEASHVSHQHDDEPLIKTED